MKNGIEIRVSDNPDKPVIIRLRIREGTADAGSGEVSVKAVERKEG